MAQQPNSNMRKVLAVIWNERPVPADYALLIQVLEGVLSKRQVYDAVANLKRFHLIDIEHINNEVRASITIKKTVEEKTQELLIEAKLI